MCVDQLPKTMRILIVEDDIHIAEQLLRDLKEAGHTCFWASNITTGLEQLGRFEAEFVLLDLMLPDGTGFDFIQKARKTSSVPIIVLTAKMMSDDKVRALDVGADDYVTKPFWSEELLARIRSVARRYQRTPEPITLRKIGELSIDMKAMTVTSSTGPCQLTPTEFDLLAYFLQRPNEALRWERLVHCVLEKDDATAGTLQVHVSRLRKKLQKDGARIETIWGIGYRFNAE